MLMLFPKLSSKNLLGETIMLPYDLDDKLNLIIIAFQRWQQDEVETWRKTKLAIYEVPALSIGYILMKPIIDGGMKSGIPDDKIKSRTITIYDKNRVKELLQIKKEDHISVFLVNHKGEILNKFEGNYKNQKFKEVKTEKATFSAGCFWGVEEHFRKLDGVEKTTVGYAGGTTENPTYHNIGDYAESVEIEFDPKKITYKQLLDEFWKIHDYTQLNRQGPDVGTQYRSAIFYHNPKQKAQIKLPKGAVTIIQKAGKFYKAEQYHQRYSVKTGRYVC